MNLQEKFDRLYEQKRKNPNKKIFIRGEVSMTQKDVIQLNQNKKIDFIIVS